MNRLILFLVRKKLRLKKNEYFRFTNQKTDNVYYIGSYGVWKLESRTHYMTPMLSNVSVNWLLNDNCKIVKVREF